MSSRIIESKVVNHSNIANMEQIKKFREARTAREHERMLKLREKRIMSSSAAASTSSASISITRSTSSVLRAKELPSSRLNKQCIQRNQSKPPSDRQLQQDKKVPAVKKALVFKTEQKSPVSRKSLTRASLGVVASKINAMKRKVPNHVGVNKRAGRPTQKPIKHTKASQLRLLRGNRTIELAAYKVESSPTLNSLRSHPFLRDLVNNPSTSELSFLKKCTAQPVQPIQNSTSTLERKGNPQYSTKEPHRGAIKRPHETSKPETPSRIPIKRTSFASPKVTPRGTPRPACLRDKLGHWLENNGHSLDDFKHLSCFGISGSAVKRPQTPFRKNILSTSVLKAIPESAESTPKDKSLSSDSSEGIDLDTTFTVEEENKENIDDTGEPKKVPDTGSKEDAESRALDQAFGVLSELQKLIRTGYPLDQCELWVRAIRRRFPQCGDEAIYWECLASLEEAKGDWSMAVACYERAITQGAEKSVRASLDELRRKLAELDIESMPSTSTASGMDASSSRRRMRDSCVDNTNIIRSSSIQFVVQEKVPQKSASSSAETDSEAVFTATPVRRSARATASPFHVNRTPGMQCVRSLDVLEPSVRKSLVFHNNSALEPRG